MSRSPQWVLIQECASCGHVQPSRPTPDGYECCHKCGEEELVEVDALEPGGVTEQLPTPPALSH